MFANCRLISGTYVGVSPTPRYAEIILRHKFAITVVYISSDDVTDVDNQARMSAPAQRGKMAQARHVRLSRTARGKNLWASATNETSRNACN